MQSENKIRIIIILYILFAYIGISSYLCIFNVHKEIFNIEVLACDSGGNFLSLIYIILAILPLLKKINEKKDCVKTSYLLNNKTAITYLLFTATLIASTTYLISENSYAVLGHHNSESSFKLAGITSNVREVVIPCLIYSFLSFKNRTILLNLAMLVLYVSFMYGEIFIRFTKGPLIGSIVILLILYGSKFKKKYIAIAILFVFTYILGYEYISSLRTGVINTDIDFYANISKIIDRFTGYPDFYLIYSYLNENPALHNFNNAADFYKEHILQIPSDSFHGQATGLFGLSLLNFGIIGGGIFILFYSSLIRIFLINASRISNITIRSVINIIIFLEIIPIITDGNFKISGLTSSGLLRALGLICFLSIFYMYCEKFCKMPIKKCISKI